MATEWEELRCHPGARGHTPQACYLKPAHPAVIQDDTLREHFGHTPTANRVTLRVGRVTVPSLRSITPPCGLPFAARLASVQDGACAINVSRSYMSYNDGAKVNGCQWSVTQGHIPSSSGLPLAASQSNCHSR